MNSANAHAERAPGPRFGQLVPVVLQVEPLRALLVIDLEDDRGSEFIGVEPQLVDGPDGAQCLRVLRYRADGRVDVYREDGNRVETSLGAGLADVVDVEFTRSRMNLGPGALDVDIEFVDAAGARNRVRLHQTPVIGRPCTFLAPIGAGVESPSRLFCVVMRGFDLVRRRGTTVEIELAGTARSVATFPPVLDGRPTLMARYSADPVVCEINAAGFTAARVAADGVTEVDGARYTTADGVLRSVEVGTGDRTGRLVLTPGLPDVEGLADGERRESAWELTIAGAPTIAGLLTATGVAGGADLSLTVTRGWRPRRVPLGMRLLTIVKPVFRTWPTTYRWDGRVAGGVLTGEWRRTEGAQLHL